MSDVPVVRIIDLGENRFAHPDNAQVRVDEVCMVFRRRDGQLLTFRKTFYPKGVYRLPTGGVNSGEGIVEALRREVREETGLPADPHRLLAAIGYQIGGMPKPCCYSFAFLLDQIKGTPTVADVREQVEEFRWASTDDLLRIADDLERLGDEHSPDLESTWSDWGRFRAVIHRVVWEILTA